MKCPYNLKLTKKIVNEESSVCKDKTTRVVKTYKYCDCIKSECAVYYDGRCHYNG